MSYRDGQARSPEVIIVERCIEDVARQGGDIRNDTMAMKRLEQAAEKAVIELQSAERTEVNLPFITAIAKGPLHIQFEIRRRNLEGAGGPSGPITPSGVKLG